ncbi:MAG TPA: membrane protein insertase YidC [Anaeromyxobacter sp.]
MGPDNRRILIATVASVAILILWSVTPWGRPKAPPPRPAPSEVAKAPAPAAPPAGAPASPAIPAPPPNAREETVKLTGGGFEAVLSSHGGAVKSLVLQGDKFRSASDRGDAAQIDLVRVTKDQPYLLALVASPELGGAQDVAGDPGARAPMRIVARDARSVTFEGRVGNVDVKKVFRLTGKPFELAVDVEVTGAAPGGAIALLFPGHTPPNAHKGGMFSGPPIGVVRPVCRAGDKTERYDLGGDQGAEKLSGPVSWVGVDAGYFIAAALPQEPLGTCLFERGPEKGSGLASLRVPVEGGTGKVSLTVYAGPKDLDMLRGYGRAFDAAIDYGAMARPFAFFARILLYVMRWFEKIVGNWGVAIILLTLLVKLLLYPLTAKSMKSMNEMRKLQPEIDKLKVKYAGDRDKLNMSTMQLYQQHKVNPLGGCLPMLLQLPIWFALYATLQTSVELYREPFLWMHDLTRHDPFFILPVAMGLSSFAMQKISPQPADNAQAKMMLYFMPIFFSVLMLFVPGGLTLYIFVNNVLSIAQQQFLMRRQTALAKA